MVAGQAQHIIDAEGCRAENIGLQGNPVSVPHHHLEHWFQALQLQMDTGSQTAQPGDRGLIIGEIDGIDMIFNQAALVNDMGRITRTRRTALAGNRHLTTLKNLFKFAFSFDFHD